VDRAAAKVAGKVLDAPGRHQQDGFDRGLHQCSVRIGPGQLPDAIKKLLPQDPPRPQPLPRIDWPKKDLPRWEPLPKTDWPKEEPGLNLCSARLPDPSDPPEQPGLNLCSARLPDPNDPPEAPGLNLCSARIPEGEGMQRLLKDLGLA